MSFSLIRWGTIILLTGVLAVRRSISRITTGVRNVEQEEENVEIRNCMPTI
jgi:hypothetical protein